MPSLYKPLVGCVVSRYQNLFRLAMFSQFIHVAQVVKTTVGHLLATVVLAMSPLVL